MFAVATIHECYERHNSQRTETVPPKILDNLKKALTAARKSLDGLKRLEAEHPDLPNATETFYQSRRFLTGQLGFIHLYNGTVDSTVIAQGVGQEAKIGWPSRAFEIA